jgi:hypothetical protein
MVRISYIGDEKLKKFLEVLGIYMKTKEARIVAPTPLRLA